MMGYIGFSWWAVVAVIIACVHACYTDLKNGTISNWTTYGLMLIGFVGNVITAYFVPNGLAMLAHTVLLSGIFFVLLYILFQLKSLGGGDVKLLTGIALCLPDILVLLTLCFYIFAVGLGYSIYVRARKLKEKEIPYAPIILVGTILAIIVNLLVLW